MNILLINAHPDPKSALSATNQMVRHLLAKLPAKSVETVNLAETAIQPLDKPVLDMFVDTFFHRKAPNPAELKILDNIHTWVAQLKATPRLIIALPMYNFGIPARLKDWIDNIVIPDQTFRYDEHGSPEGMLTGHKALILTASGGIYSEGDFARWDFTVPYLETVLGFLGFQSVESVRAEGTSPDVLGTEAAAQKACAEIDAVWADFLAE